MILSILAMAMLTFRQLASSNQSLTYQISKTSYSILSEKPKWLMKAAQAWDTIQWTLLTSTIEDM